MKKYLFSLVLFLPLVFAACQKEITAVFSYSPDSPAAGKRVYFTNLSENGSSYLWDFGDGGTSDAQSPSHVFSKAGYYTVTMRVNGSGQHTAVKTVRVLDSIPEILRDSATVYYNRPVTFSVSVFNSNNDSVKYKWTFSKNAVSDSIGANGNATANSLTVRFTKPNIEDTVKLELTVGKTVYNLIDVMKINDIPYPSIVFATSEGKLYRKRIVENVNEEPILLINSELLSTLIVQGNNLYFLTNNAIKVFNFKSKQNETIISPSQNGFCSGFILNDDVFWADSTENIYKISVSERDKIFDVAAGSASPYFIANSTNLGIPVNQKTGEIALYDNLIFWSKCGNTSKGIFILDKDNPTQLYKLILSGLAILHCSIDAVNQRLYYVVENTGLFTSKLDGTDQKLIESANSSVKISNLAIDNAAEKVYWAYNNPDKNGEHILAIQATALVKSSLQQTFEIEEIMNGFAATVLALDPVKRLSNE